MNLANHTITRVDPHTIRWIRKIRGRQQIPEDTVAGCLVVTGLKRRVVASAENSFEDGERLKANSGERACYTVIR